MVNKLNQRVRPRFLQRFEESQTTLLNMLKRGYSHWIITFSGGKDSTTTTIIAIETALISVVERIDVVYCDTELEIPVIYQYAMSFLGYLKKNSRLTYLPLHVHILRPLLNDSFWVCLLGKGYPPPHQRFRWCTRRLKINPVKDALKAIIQPNKTIILTGVRFGESRSRDIRLLNSCRRGGECGQGVWFEYSPRLKVGYLAPIVNWSECDVWDFLLYCAYKFGYPTHYLETHIYNGRDTRFGCWMCTVVNQDKTMEKITAQPQWSHLKPLLHFRQRVKELSSHIESRVLRPDGKPGRLTLEVRRQLLNELLKLQRDLGMEIISPEEVQMIQEYWNKELEQGGV